MTTDLKETIKHKRPKLSDSSITTYSSILKNLYKKVFGTGEIDIKKFEDSKDILEHLKSITPNKRKSILSALVVITNDKKYRDLMLEDIKAYNTETSKQEKTDTQKAGWIHTNTISSVLETFKKNANLLYKKTELSSEDLQNIQSYIILCLLGGSYIPPRRAGDYCNFCIKNIDKERDNYLDKNELVFNTYKTSKCYGQQKVTCPPELLTILKKWIKRNPTDHLLFDTKNNKLSNVQLNQKLNKIFGSKSGKAINALRHSYLSSKFQSTIEENKKINDTMADMGSSAQQLKVYVQKE